MTSLPPLHGPLAALMPRLAPGAIAIESLQRLSGGASQETWRFDLVGPGQRTTLILRRAPDGDRLTHDGIGLEVEAALATAAAAHGVPVANVRHVLTPQDGLGLGFIMDFVDGETLGGRIVKSPALAAARLTLAHQCGGILARIHAIDPASLPTLRTFSAAELVAHWRTSYRATAVPRPVFETAFHWLRANLPPAVPPRLVHGDFRNGNLMVGPAGVRAVLDWELAHVGDPAEDIGWLCVGSWRFGQIDKPVGGFGELADLCAGYAAAGGAPIDTAALKWWQMFGTLRWGTMCAGSTATFRSVEPTVERAMIARRTSETEIDLLRLLAA